MSDTLLIGTTDEGVRTITLNRPEKLNAVNMALADELPIAVDEASKDAAVRVVVLIGAGRGFCAGLELSQENLAEMRGRESNSSQATRDGLGWVGRWAITVTNCEKPVIAAINGPVVGAGLGLALASDIRLMSDAAIISTGYSRIGLCPDAGVSYFLPRLIGLARATDLIFTSRDVKPEEAAAIGLVARVLPAEGFAAQVAEYAKQIALGPPIGLSLAKRLLTDSFNSDLMTHLRAEFSSIGQCLASEDAGEAMRAFQEKRRPVFQGR
jgi:2-(1,2-epoxy-1,2-dihydrophenyl)acetyl-CoA isomerase